MFRWGGKDRRREACPTETAEHYVGALRDEALEATHLQIIQMVDVHVVQLAATIALRMVVVDHVGVEASGPATEAHRL